MIDLDALAGELSRAGWTIQPSTTAGLIFVQRAYGAGRLAEFHITDQGGVDLMGYGGDGAYADRIPVDARLIAAIRIIERYVKKEGEGDRAREAGG